MAWFMYLIPPFSFILLQFNKNVSIYYLVFDLSGLWGENEVSRVKRGRWNKKIWETLVLTVSI